MKDNIRVPREESARFKSGSESTQDEARQGTPPLENHEVLIQKIGALIRNIFTRWVSRMLTKEMKEKRISACKELFKRYEIEGEGFLDRIVTGDESWIHHHVPYSQRSSAEWHHKGSPTPKKPRITASARKVLLTIFWDS
ncbi:hypothetical protein LAZ67_1000547 [Cordylochernes scorpioides]|uniref:Uncharacterized protein n=1 Tax=Cordylochernes scorpioides TaxID=51811 RepID=A0ABY6JUT1_9ARAC|nr:hypothetical protein LAZ67_1000547 [Cordylochernes scorpioides]